MEKNLLNLTAPQKSIWLTEQYYENTNINNICATVIVSQLLDFDILKKALNLVIQNHDNFNTHFIEENGELKQYFKKIDYQNFEIVELDSTDDISKLEQQLLSKVFNIKENLFEIKIFKIKNSNTCGCLINIHHIIADAYSIGLLCQNLMNTYNILLKNESVEFNSNFSYESYIQAEQEYINSKKFEADKHYWDEKFSTIPNIVSIPSTKKNVESISSSKAKRYIYTIPESIVNNINIFCGKNRISIFNLFMAILSIYINKINNENDFVIGTPILNRTNFNEKNTLGMFINVAPFRVNLNSENTINSFLSEISSDLMGLLRHQKYSNLYILDSLRKSNASIPNLYNIVLSYQITKTNTDSNLDYSTRWAFNNNAGNDIELHIFDFNNQGILELAYDYRTEKYYKNEIENLNKRLLYILKQILNNPNEILKNIQIATPDEQNIILTKFNHNIDTTNKETVISLFEKQVKNLPNEIALIYNEEKLTYSELNKKVNKLANYLKEKNLDKNIPISVCMSRNTNYIISILAILKNNCAFLPINPEYPQKRIDYILENSNSKLCIIDSDINLSISNEKILDLRKIDLNNYSEKNLYIDINTNDLAYIIYTSGTTGNPKGVLLKHKNLVNFVNAFNNAYNQKFSKKDNCLSLTNISFDVSVGEIFTPLLLGASLVLYPENNFSSIPKLCEILEKNEITFLYLPPNILLDVYNFIKNNTIKTNINKILVGVEPIKSCILRKYFNLNPNMEIINGYGPTETTICCTFFKFENSHTNNIVPIGKPLDNNLLLVLDNDLNLTPIGNFGELYVSGENVGKGYLNKPDLTNERFISIPKFSNSVFYKTGDLVSWNENGILNFKSRNDSQIKFNGNRIELDEINSKICEIDQIISSITVILEKNSKKYLCSFFKSTKEISENEIKNILSASLPRYMIPNHISRLENFPLTINGKIDKSKLPFPETPNSEIINISPKTETEFDVQHIFEKLLKTKINNIEENIFNLGIDSLLCIQATSLIYEKFNIRITIKDIFNNPSISLLANFIDKKSNIQFDILKIKEQEYYHTSSAQKRIYYASKLSDFNSTVYNISGGIEFFETLDFEKIKYCFNVIVQRYESFRTYFEIIDGEIYQKILPSINLNITKTYCNVNNINLEFEKFNTAFDLSKAPLLKIQVLFLNNGHTMIFISMHHIISDGTSMQILLQDFYKLYNNQELDPKKFTYKDFINYEQYYSGSYNYANSKDFWLNEFSEEIPILNLPTDFLRPSQFTYLGAKYQTTIPEDLTKQILKVSKENQVTPYMFLLACYYILLYKYTNQTHIVIGSPVANRNIPEFSNLIGMFVNTLPIKKKIPSEIPFLEFLKDVKEKCLSCLENQNYPFDELVKNLNLNRDVSRNPLFDTMFIYQNSDISNLDILDKKIKYYIPDTHISKFDLSLEIIPKKLCFDINFEYCTNLFKKETIENLSIHYIELIKNVLKDANTHISQLEILTIYEKNKILYEFNNTRKLYNKNLYIYNLIDNQCKKTPDKTAITFKNQTLTYEQLYNYTNSLANYMHNLNIGKGSIVGIMLPRGFEVLLAIIATLKTGACYIPIDPSFPVSRINYMLENSNAALLITNSKNTISSIPTLDISLTNSTIYDSNTELHFENNLTPNDPSYIIYTSGSTGNPKGVVLNHKALNNLTNYLNNYVDYLKNDYENMAIASLTTISFDIFIFETIISLQKGLNVVMATENEQTMPDRLNTLIEKNNIKAFQLTPSRMEILLNNLNLIPNLTNIKYITLAGEALSKKLVDSIKSLGEITIYNGYGPSETTVFSTFTDVTNYDIITIGKPLDNTQFYIFDRDNNICPIGVPGELCICGDGVGIGYKNIAPTVKNNYTISPISHRPMYKTGDLVKFLPNGELLYLGRIDNQIKIRGLRIELEEIENKILEYPNIKKTVILAETDSNNRKYLIAYITISDKISINKLREHLRKTLPKYMIPSYFEILDDFPYLPNGKINKKELPQPSQKNKSQELLPARNDMDRKLILIFENLLNLSPISITDNFFELGGDSLLAINLQIELLKFTDEITYADIFLNPTVQELSDKINNITNIPESLSNTIDLLNCNSYIQKKLQVENNYNSVDVRNLLLTGATGFLGAHILNEFIRNSTCTIYCLLRKEKGISLRDKLQNQFHFYFGNELDMYIGNRIQLLEGDISQENLGLSLTDYNFIKDNIQIILNCAAKVSHFGKYELYKKINVDAVKRLVDFSKNNNKKLYHISTTSVSGDSLNSNTDFITLNNKTFSEYNFFINQKIENVYVKSKFEAEKYIIQELPNGLDAYILRVGNLMGRYTDGKFQRNIEENAYINRLLSFIRMKTIPSDFMEHKLEFTPVDCAANAIFKIISHETNHRIFHITNDNLIPIAKLVSIFNDNYYKINTLDLPAFNEYINSLIQTNNYPYLNGIITDFNKNGKLSYAKEILINSDFTKEYLSKVNFYWPIIDEHYILQFLNYLKTIYNF